MKTLKPREVKNYKMYIANIYSQICIKFFREAIIHNLLEVYVFSFFLSTNNIILRVQATFHTFSHP